MQDNWRTRARNDSAAVLNNFTPEELNTRFGISRVAEITGFDRVGVPVYQATRPAGRSISMSAGKGLNRVTARAGAIAEGIELWSAENPSGPNVVRSWADFNQGSPELLPFGYATIWRPDMPTCFEEVTRLVTKESFFLPSDVLWLEPRLKTGFLLFQSSTNGLALGFRITDALLQGIYELIERDAWTLNEILAAQVAKYPNPVEILNPAFDLEHLIEACRKVDVAPFLYDLSVDSVPVWGAQVLDLAANTGVFFGFGCHSDPQVAAFRALIEAVQSRAIYIVGARDDLFRRKFHELKNHDDGLKWATEAQQKSEPKFLDSKAPSFESVEEELTYVLASLPVESLQNLYYKVLWADEALSLYLVKSVLLGFEGPRMTNWSPGNRARKVLAQLA